jgi:thiol-disulfide isomerase/thioredoxin
MKYKYLIILTVFVLLVSQTTAQNTITGNFSSIKGQTVRLMGYRGVDVFTIDTAVVNAEGNFELHYSDANLGMGYLVSSEGNPYMVVLEKGKVKLTGKILLDATTIVINNGEQNKLFVKYALDHGKREQALSAWGYLKNLYELDTLFKNEYATKFTITKEIDHLNKTDNDYLKTLPPNSFMSWYLPIRKLISDVGAVANTRPQEIPSTIKAFRSINYADPLLYTSGLFSDLLESQFWLIENSGLERNMLAKEMNTSVDSILASVNKNEKLYNEFTNYLFQYFEKNSLFASSEYIALKALNQQEMRLSMALVNRLETYRKIKIGGIAPKIEFKGDVYVNRELVNNINNLSDIKSKYKVVIFGGSWCERCRSEVIQVIPHYETWKKQGIEVAIVSLDTDKKAFEEFATEFPFIFACDYKKWETQAAKDFYVSSSPTLFLLDSDNKIILRPSTIPVLDSWLKSNSLIR